MQVRVDLPPVRQVQAEKAVDDAIERLAAQFGIFLEPSRMSSFAVLYHRHVAPTLRTPRFINTWFNHIELLFPPLRLEVDFVDFIVLTWLRLLHPGLPAMLQEHKSDLFPSIDALGIENRRTDETEQLTRWKTWIKKAGVASEDEQRVLAVLGSLFPAIEEARIGRKLQLDSSIVGARLGVGHPNYFERYFHLGVPDEELSEAALRSEMAALVSNAPATAYDRLTRHLKSDPRSTSARVEQWYQPRQGYLLPVLYWLASSFAGVDDAGLFSGQSTLRGLMFRLARLELPDTALTAISTLLGDEDTLYPAGLLVHDLIREDTETPVEIDLNRLRSLAVLAIEHEVSIRTRKPTELDRSYWALLWLWSWLEPEEARRWYRSLVLGGRWSLLEALAGLVSSATSIGVANPTTKLRGLPDENIETFLGIEWVIDFAITTNVQVFGSTAKANDFDGPADSWVARLAVARAELERLLKRGRSDDTDTSYSAT